jgi:hypothetical protein
MPLPLACQGISLSVQQATLLSWSTNNTRSLMTQNTTLHLVSSRSFATTADLLNTPIAAVYVACTASIEASLNKHSLRLRGEVVSACDHVARLPFDVEPDAVIVSSEESKLRCCGVTIAAAFAHILERAEQNMTARRAAAAWSWHGRASFQCC